MSLSSVLSGLHVVVMGLDRWTFPRTFIRLVLSRYEAAFGASHAGTQDRSYRFGRVEERVRFDAEHLKQQAA